MFWFQHDSQMDKCPSQTCSTTAALLAVSLCRPSDAQDWAAEVVTDLPDGLKWRGWAEGETLPLFHIPAFPHFQDFFCCISVLPHFLCIGAPPLSQTLIACFINIFLTISALPFRSPLLMESFWKMNSQRLYSSPLSAPSSRFTPTRIFAGNCKLIIALQTTSDDGQMSLKWIRFYLSFSPFGLDYLLTGRCHHQVF